MQRMFKETQRTGTAAARIAAGDVAHHRRPELGNLRGSPSIRADGDGLLSALMPELEQENFDSVFGLSDNDAAPLAIGNPPPVTVCYTDEQRQNPHALLAMVCNRPAMTLQKKNALEKELRIQWGRESDVL